MTLSARNWAWDIREPLKAGEKLTLLCIAESENAEWGYACPGNNYVAIRTCQSLRTVGAHLRRLEELKLITRERRRSTRGRWDHYVYVLPVPESYRAHDRLWQELQG